MDIVVVVLLPRTKCRQGRRLETTEFTCRDGQLEAAFFCKDGLANCGALAWLYLLLCLEVNPVIVIDNDSTEFGDEIHDKAWRAQGWHYVRNSWNGRLKVLWTSFLPFDLIEQHVVGQIWTVFASNRMDCEWSAILDLSEKRPVRFPLVKQSWVLLPIALTQNPVVWQIPIFFSCATSRTGEE